MKGSKGCVKGGGGCVMRPPFSARPAGLVPPGGKGGSFGKGMMSPPSLVPPSNLVPPAASFLLPPAPPLAPEGFLVMPLAAGGIGPGGNPSSWDSWDSVATGSALGVPPPPAPAGNIFFNAAAAESPLALPLPAGVVGGQLPRPTFLPPPPPGMGIGAAGFANLMAAAAAAMSGPCGLMMPPMPPAAISPLMFPPALQSGVPGMPPSVRQKTTWPVFVGNIAFDTPEEEVNVFFRGRQGLASFRVATQAGGGSRGFGFAEFNDPLSALEAIKAIDNQDIRGRRLRLRWGENSSTTPEVDEFHRAPERWKTRPCYEVYKKIPCPRGDNCPYAHVDSELRKLGGASPPLPPGDAATALAIAASGPGGSAAARRGPAVAAAPPAFVKVPVPFSDFPGATDEEKQRAAYNAVLGNGASNVRGMMKKTGCRLQLRGAGDRAASASKDADSKEPLHLIVRPGLDGKMINDEALEHIRRTIDDIVAVATGKKQPEEIEDAGKEEKGKEEKSKEEKGKEEKATDEKAKEEVKDKDEDMTQKIVQMLAMQNKASSSSSSAPPPTMAPPAGPPPTMAPPASQPPGAAMEEDAAPAAAAASAEPAAEAPAAEAVEKAAEAPPPEAAAQAAPRQPAKPPCELGEKCTDMDCPKGHPRFPPRPDDDAPVQFFVMRSANLSSIQTSVRHGVWATSRFNTQLLEEAFRKVGHVVLLFSADQTGHFQGYARMEAAPHKDLKPGLWGQMSDRLGSSFKVAWLKQCMLPFSQTDGLRNGTLDGQSLRKSRDGQEVPDELGEQLVRLMWQQRSEDLLALPADDDDDVDALLQGAPAARSRSPRGRGATPSIAQRRRPGSRSRSRGRRGAGGSGAWVPPGGTPPPGPWVPPSSVPAPGAWVPPAGAVPAAGSGAPTPGGEGEGKETPAWASKPANS